MTSNANPSSSADFGKKRILVAEPASPDRFSIFGFLEQAGIEAKLVHNLDEAIIGLRKGAVSFTPFHLFIVTEDILTGAELQEIKTLRQKSGTAELKVALVSKVDNPHETPAGVDAVIRGAVEPNQLRSALEAIFKTRTLKTAPAPAAGKTILVVEDDSLSQELLKIVLTKNGHAVQLASTGSEAIAACEKESFDLIFMDLQMPGIDGFTAATRIHALEPRTRDLPIVALTASNISGEAYERFDGEFTRVLTKPFEIPVLLQTIFECTTRPMDIPQALPHFDLDPQQYRSIFEEFLSSLPARLADMEHALQSGDMTTLARRAHNLKGTSANVGAMQLSLIAARLDDQCDRNDAVAVNGTYRELTAAVEFLQQNAREILNSHFQTAPQSITRVT